MLTAEHSRALGLVLLAGRSRAEAAAATGLELATLGRLLAEARKALRKSVCPLEGRGWCERAEGLISDRLDGALDARGGARLEVHLRNCPRCVEHERRLVQAQDALVISAAATLPAHAGTPAPELSLVGKAGAEPEASAADGSPSVQRDETARLAAFTFAVLISLALLLLLAAVVLAVAGLT